jgi:hypothetical protein
MSQRTPFQWNTANFAWNSNPYTWDDVALIVSLVGGGVHDPLTVLKKDKSKKEHFVKLLCKVQGIEYQQQHQKKDIKITIEDVELVAREVLGLNITVDV